MSHRPVPEFGSAHEVAPGVRWIRLPMPFALDHINAWALTEVERMLLVDTGLNDAATMSCWDRFLQAKVGPGGAPGVGGRVDVLVTHFHPDHIGMAGPLVERLGGRLHITRGEYAEAQEILRRVRSGISDVRRARFLRRAGWPGESVEGSFLDDGFANTVGILPRTFVALADGDRIEAADTEWEVVTGSGHSPQHACLYGADRALFISGDQVLEHISSNVSVFADAPEADPMDGWLRSIARIRARVPDEVLVLPAHHTPFRGLHARLAQLERGQHDALDRLRAALAAPIRAVDAIEPLFRRRIDRGALFEMATGESLACLNHLINRDEVVVEDDADGVAWYRNRPHGRRRAPPRRPST